MQFALFDCKLGALASKSAKFLELGGYAIWAIAVNLIKQFRPLGFSISKEYAPGAGNAHATRQTSRETRTLDGSVSNQIENTSNLVATSILLALAIAFI